MIEGMAWAYMGQELVMTEFEVLLLSLANEETRILLELWSGVLEFGMSNGQVMLSMAEVDSRLLEGMVLLFTVLV